MFYLYFRRALSTRIYHLFYHTYSVGECDAACNSDACARDGGDCVRDACTFALAVRGGDGPDLAWYSLEDFGVMLYFIVSSLFYF